MRAPGRPYNEIARVQVLRDWDLLDTEAEEELDRLTTAAANLFQAPVSLISLVDAERQWFKSCLGLDVKQTTRAVSFCAHAILDEAEVFIVEDARRDERFSDNPLVLGGPRIVSYVGVKLTTADGFHLGTLCVIDRKPMEIHDAQVHALQVLRDQAMRHMALRRRAVKSEQARDDAGLRISVVSDRMHQLMQELGTALYGDGEVEQLRRRMQNEIKHMQQVLEDWERPLMGGEVTS